MIKNIVLIRHGQTDGNLKKRYIGITDEPLSLQGQREILRRAAKGCYPMAEQVYTSTLLRTMETAKLIYPNCIPEIISELSECDFGIFENKCYEELKDLPEYRTFIDSMGEGPIPGGESAPAFRKRCCTGFLKAVDDMVKRQTARAALVCHGGTIMSVMSEFDENKKDFYSYQVPNGGGMEIQFDTQDRCAKIIKEW